MPWRFCASLPSCARSDEAWEQCWWWSAWCVPVHRACQQCWMASLSMRVSGWSRPHRDGVCSRDGCRFPGSASLHFGDGAWRMPERRAAFCWRPTQVWSCNLIRCDRTDTLVSQVEGYGRRTKRPQIKARVVLAGPLAPLALSSTSTNSRLEAL